MDLLLHTPGGDIAAAESLVDYLHKMFNGNIRAIIPQISMSAGTTMIACACKSIVMGKQSNLGPIDPQINGLPAKSIIDEFNTAIEKITENPNSLPLWQIIIGKYHPSFLTSCQHAVKWSEEMVGKWLEEGMFSKHENAKQLADAAVSKLSATDENYTHGRHIHMERCKDIGLKIDVLENDKTLQDLVLTVHHSYMHTFNLGVIKIVENHLGEAVVNIPPQVPNQTMQNR